jgi:membrane protease YdiL (CAAX protease family)
LNASPTPAGPADAAAKVAVRPTGYLAVTRTATYGFLAALPLLVLYEVMILVANRANGIDVRVGAEVWIKQILLALGPSWVVLLGVLVIGVGVAILMSERHKKLPIRADYFGGIVLESALYAVVVAGIVSRIVALVFASNIAPGVASGVVLAGSDLSFGLFTNLALSIGAGLYEELVFRVILVGGLFALLKALLGQPVPAYVFAALIGAAIFSWVHYVGPLGDPFEWASFSFRFLFGLALNVVFLLRGFGVAAWTHALYDVFVVTHLFG